MPEIATRSPHNPEFARVIDVARLRGLAEFDFDLAASSEEALALARLMEARSVRKLRFRGRLTPAREGAWLLDGELGATVVQSCVVTLAPVTTRIDVPVRRRFAPGYVASAEIAAQEIEDEDEIEPLGATIDLGLVAIEALALALPAYPRAPNATLKAATSAPPGAAPLTEAEVRPFSALAALRAKMGEGR